MRVPVAAVLVAILAFAIWAANQPAQVRRVGSDPFTTKPHRPRPVDPSRVQAGELIEESLRAQRLKRLAIEHGEALAKIEFGTEEAEAYARRYDLDPKDLLWIWNEWHTMQIVKRREEWAKRSSSVKPAHRPYECVTIDRWEHLDPDERQGVPRWLATGSAITATGSTEEEARANHAELYAERARQN